MAKIHCESTPKALKNMLVETRHGDMTQNITAGNCCDYVEYDINMASFVDWARNIESVRCPSSAK